MTWCNILQRYYRAGIFAVILGTVTVLFLETSFCRDCFSETPQKQRATTVIVRNDLQRLRAPFIHAGSNHISDVTASNLDGARENRFAQILVAGSTGSQQLTNHAHVIAKVTSKNHGSEEAVKGAPFSKLRLNRVPESETFLHWALLDNRQPKKQSILRIFATQNRTRLKHDRLRCEILSKSGRFLELPQDEAYAIYPSWPSPDLIYQAYYFGFKIPYEIEMSITTTATTAGLVRCFLNSQPTIPLVFEYSVVGPPPQTVDVAMCVRVTYGEFDALRLIEWFEFNRILGVKKFGFYTRQLHPDTERVLRYYENIGVADVTQVDFNDYLWSNYIRHDPVATSLRHADWLMEQVYFTNINHCLYTLGARFSHVLLVDLDEFIIPSNPSQSLQTLISRLHAMHPNFAGFTIAPMWHFDEFGPVHVNSSDGGNNNTDSGSNSVSLEEARNMTHIPLHTQRYLLRTPIIRSQPKTIFISGTYVTANMHAVTTSVDGFGQNIYINDEHICALHHFRYECKNDVETCKTMMANPVRDDVIPQHSDKLQERVKSIVNGVTDSVGSKVGPSKNTT